MSVVACYLRSRQSRHNIICFEMLFSGDSGGRLPCIFPFDTTNGTHPPSCQVETASDGLTDSDTEGGGDLPRRKKSRARIGPLNLCEPMGFDSYDVLFLFFF